jgi:hypothetical protein
VTNQGEPTEFGRITCELKMLAEKLQLLSKTTSIALQQVADNDLASPARVVDVSDLQKGLPDGLRP